MSESPRWNRLSESLFCRRWIELGDFREAFCMRRVRAGDKGATHLGAVPARCDTETQRFFGFDVTRGKNLHGGSLGARCSHVAGTSCGPPAVRLLGPNSHDFLS